MAARVVAVVGRKGGAGKTTISVHLADALAARGRRVTLIDADPQGSAMHWGAPGRLAFPVEAMPVTLDALGVWVATVRATKADVVVVDCPPHADAALGAAVGLADLAVLPCGPSGLDAMALGPVLDVLRQARAQRRGKPPALIVPNRVDRRTAEGREIADELAQLGEPIGPALAYRSAFVRAFSTGETVRTAAPGSPAAVEVAALADAVEEGLR